MDDLNECPGIWDNYSLLKTGYYDYIHCVPDIIYLDSGYFNDRYLNYEYWLDDNRSTYVRCSGNYEQIFDVYDSSDNLIKSIPSKRTGYSFSDKSGFIEKNGGYYYIRPDNTAVLAWSSFKNDAPDYNAKPVNEPFVVESEINGCPVTDIDKLAFFNSLLTEIILPDSIQFIGDGAFRECLFLEKINFPKNLKYINRDAFSRCISLKKVDIDCPGLELLWGTFVDCNELTDVRLNVKAVCEEAFSFCPNLKNITLDGDITGVYANAFKDCPELESITLTKGTRIIGQGAFLNTGIKSVTILPTVDIIGALPMKRSVEYTDLWGRVENFPLTDEPECAFDSDCVIYGYKNTETERYAKEWNLDFVTLEAVKGDVNFDGKFNIADVVTLQKWLTDNSGTKPAYWKAADLSDDNKLDIWDLVLMKRKLLNEAKN